MIRLTFPGPVFQALRAHLLQSSSEQVALVFAHEVHMDGATTLIARRWEPVPSKMLTSQADMFAVNSSFVASQAKRARARSESIFLAHSHPASRGMPSFSPADTRGEANLYDFLRRRLPERIHGALVLSPEGMHARVCLPQGTVTPVDEVRVVGRTVQIIRPHVMASAPTADEAHDRQRLMWGDHAQGILRDLCIAVVGAGGIGSVVAQQLIHLGVGRLIVIDNQVVEESNLARVVGARKADVGVTAKVDVVARLAAEVDPTVAVMPIQADVCTPAVAARLRGADLIYLCTDRHWSRAVVNAVAVQYAIPLVDMGFLIDVNTDAHQVISAVGEVRIVVPGGYCLSCTGVLDADRIRAEKASPEERAAFPGYFSGLDVHEPSVITVNSVIASLAVTVGIDMFIPTMRSTGALDSYRYNALKGLVSHAGKRQGMQCGVCGSDGIGAFGDALPIAR